MTVLICSPQRLKLYASGQVYLARWSESWLGRTGGAAQRETYRVNSSKPYSGIDDIRTEFFVSLLKCFADMLELKNTLELHFLPWPVEFRQCLAFLRDASFSAHPFREAKSCCVGGISLKHCDVGALV